MKLRIDGPKVRVQHGRGTATAVVDADLSLRCIDCGKLRYTTRREASRAARLRCLACGGLLQETQATQRRHKAIVRDRFGDVSPLDASRGLRCPSCDARFRTEIALTLHREERHGVAKTIDPTLN